MGIFSASTGSSYPQNLNVMNGIGREVKNMQTVQVFKDETGTKRVLLGRGADDFYGLKVSKPTFNVFTASNDELVFNSSQNVFKIVDIQEITTFETTLPNCPAGETLAATSSSTFNHSLGYTPITAGFYQSGSSFLTLPYATVAAPQVDNSVLVTTQLQASATDFTVKQVVLIDCASSGTGITLTLDEIGVKVYMLQESAE